VQPSNSRAFGTAPTGESATTRPVTLCTTNHQNLCLLRRFMGVPLPPRTGEAASPGAPRARRARGAAGFGRRGHPRFGWRAHDPATARRAPSAGRRRRSKAARFSSRPGDPRGGLGDAARAIYDSFSILWLRLGRAVIAEPAGWTRKRLGKGGHEVFHASILLPRASIKGKPNQPSDSLTCSYLLAAYWPASSWLFGSLRAGCLSEECDVCQSSWARPREALTPPYP
jgi:hypothetical protein